MSKWIVKQQEEKTVAQIREKFSLGDASARVLYNRGLYDAEKIEKFFDIGISRLHDPFLLPDMSKAKDRIDRAVKNGEKITVYGDYDVDGITSVVLLYKYLKNVGADVCYYIPDRTEEGYGLNTSAIESIAEGGTSLIITVDTGTTALDEVEQAKKIGIDIVVTDHHECKPELPDCVAVVNPKRNDSEYPFKELAGVGVIFKVVCALIGDVNEAFDRFGDIVAIGTIADIMPLVDENRSLVSLGLERLRKHPGFGIKALLEASGGNKHGQVNAGTIAFQIAPRINAAGRIGDPKMSVDLLLADSYEEASVLAEGLCEENRMRRQLESDIISDVEKMIANRNPNDKIIVAGSENWHHGVIGIVASKIVEKYNLPCILMCFDGNKAKGSARSIKNVSMFDLLTKASKHLEKFGGHEMAAGLTLARQDFDAFVEDITKIANSIITEEMMIPIKEAECEISFDEMSLETVYELEKLEPFGTGNPTPYFALRDLQITDILAVGAGVHLKITFSYDGRSFTGMLFGTKPQDFDFAVNDNVDIIFSMSENYFNHKSSLSLSIKAIKLSEQQEREEKESEYKYNKFLKDGIFENEAKISRKEFSSVYRYLRRLYVNANQTVYMPHALARTLIMRGLKDMNFFRIMLCLDVLSELGIVEYVYNKKVEIIFKDTENKKNLADSKTWRRVGGE